MKFLSPPISASGFNFPVLLLYAPDLDFVQTGLFVLIDVDVDRKVGVHVAHLVLVAFGNAGDHVIDDRADGSETRNGFARAMVHFNRDGVFARVLERYGEVLEVFDEFACSPLVSEPRFSMSIRDRFLNSWVRALLLIPRGPSTVTMRVLMPTLTIGGIH